MGGGVVSLAAAPAPVRQSPVENLMPYGPDPAVFGRPKPPLEREVLGGPLMRTCRACQVQWAGDGPCWCCGQQQGGKEDGSQG